MKKKVLSMLLALAMVLGMVPANILAADVPLAVTLEDGTSLPVADTGEETYDVNMGSEFPIYQVTVPTGTEVGTPLTMTWESVDGLWLFSVYNSSPVSPAYYPNDVWGDFYLMKLTEDGSNFEAIYCAITFVEGEVGGGEEPACQHPETTTSYAQVEGEEKHTVTVKCANESCGEQVGEVTIEDCADENDDLKCDKCGGAVAAEETTVTPDKEVNLDIGEVTVKTSLIEPGVSKISVPVKVQYHYSTKSINRVIFSVKYDTDLLTFADMVSTSTTPSAGGTNTTYRYATDTDGTISVSYHYKSGTKPGDTDWLDLCDLQFTVNEGKLPTGGELTTALTVEGDVQCLNNTTARTTTYTKQDGSITLQYSDETAYNVSIGTFDNGTVTGPATKVIPGETVTLTVAPASNYALLSLSAVEDVELTKTSANTYTFVMPERDVTVTAAFAAAYSVTTKGGVTGTNGASPGSYCANTTINGTALSWAGVSVAAGSEAEIVCIPKTGYSVPKVYYTNTAGETIYIELTDCKGTFTMPSEPVALVPVVEMNPDTALTVEFGDVTVEAAALSEGSMNVVVPVYVTFENFEIEVNRAIFGSGFDAAALSYDYETGYAAGEDLASDESLSWASNKNTNVNYNFSSPKVPSAGKRHVANLTFTLASAAVGEYEVTPVNVTVNDITGKSPLTCAYTLTPGTISVVEKICDHTDTETTTTYARIADTETHNIVVTCACGETISATPEACSGASGAVECSKCFGAITPKYEVYFNDMSGGQVTADKTMYPSGETVTLTVAPDEGYELNEISAAYAYMPNYNADDEFPDESLEAVTIELTKIGDTTYTFMMPSAIGLSDLTVSATFVSVAEPVTYTLSVGTVNWSYATISVNETSVLTSKVMGRTAEIAAGAKVTVSKGNTAGGVTFNGFTTVVDGVRTAYSNGASFTMPEANVLLEFNCSTTGTASVAMGADQTDLDAASASITIPVSLSYTLGSKTAGVYVEMEYDPAVLDYTGMTGFTSVTETEDGKLLVWYSKSVAKNTAGSASGSLTFAPVAGAEGKSATVKAVAFRPYQGQMQGILDMDGETLDETRISFAGEVNSCDHSGEKTTAYTPVQGTKTHTVTVTCLTCNETVGEVITENCVDENLDEQCDKCGGVVELTKYGITLTNATAAVNGENVTAAAEGQTVVLTVIVPEGKVLDRLFVIKNSELDSETAIPIDLTRNDDGTYSFTMLGEAVTVIVGMGDAIPLEITNSEKGEITATVNGVSVTAVCEGQTVTLTANVASGSNLSRMIVKYDNENYKDQTIEVRENADGTWSFDVPADGIQVIRISADYTCAHAETTTTYAQVENEEKHTVTVTCNACSAIVGDVITESCKEIIKDGKCDLCNGDVAVTESLVSVWDGETYSSSLQTATYNGETVYLINSAADLVYWAKQNTAATTTNSPYRIQSVVLNTDIDLDNHAWTPVKKFDAVFYGMGHTISGLNVSGQGFIALMRVDNHYRPAGDAAIRDLTLEGSVTGSDVVGAFAGKTYGEVINCVSRVNVTGVEYVGGIVGSGDGTTAIRNCANYGNVTASGTHVAGILGHAEGAYVQNCYNRGNVQGADTVAGIANGSFDDAMTIRNCYNTGNVKATGDTFGNAQYGPIGGRLAYNVDNCYYLNNATYSGTVSNMAGTALSVAELKAAAGNLGNAWAEDTYNLNDGYPVQTWQVPDASKIVDLTAPTLTAATAGEAGYDENGVYYMIDNTIIVTAPEGSKQDTGAAIQYRISADGQTWSEWQSGEEFYGLTPGTTYSFQARYVSTKLHKYRDSQPSNVVSAAVAAAPEDVEIIQLSAPAMTAALADVKENSITLTYPESTYEDDYIWDEYGLAYYRIGTVGADDVVAWGEWSEGIDFNGTVTFNGLNRGTRYGIQARFVSRSTGAIASPISETMYVTTVDGMIDVNFRLIGITQPNHVGVSGTITHGGINLRAQLEAALNHKIVDGYDGAVYRTLLQTKKYNVPGGLTATNFVGYPLSANNLNYELSIHYFTKVEVPSIFADMATDDSGTIHTNGYYYGDSAGWYIFVIRDGEVFSEGEPDNATTALQDGDSVIMCFVGDSKYEMKTNPTMGAHWSSEAVNSGLTDLVYQFLETPDISHEEYVPVLALEKQIDELVVDKNSDAAIKSAEAAYEALSADQQKAVKNYKKLQEKRAQYEALQLGDLDGDNEVGQKDVTLLIQYLAERDVTIAEQYADLNKDSKVDLLDLLILRRHLAQWDGYKTLPVVPNT